MKKHTKNVRDFMNEVEELCKKYNVSISHEDAQGSFIIQRFNEHDLKLFRWASVEDVYQTEEELESDAENLKKQGYCLSSSRKYKDGINASFDLKDN